MDVLDNKKSKISILILSSFLLSGCFGTATAVVAGFNTLYNGIQTYKSIKKDVKEKGKERKEKESAK